MKLKEEIELTLLKFKHENYPVRKAINRIIFLFIGVLRQDFYETLDQGRSTTEIVSLLKRLQKIIIDEGE